MPRFREPLLPVGSAHDPGGLHREMAGQHPNERAPTAGCRASRHAAAPSAADRDPATPRAGHQVAGQGYRSGRGRNRREPAGRGCRCPVRRLPDRYPPCDPTRWCGRRHVSSPRAPAAPRCDPPRTPRRSRAVRHRPSPAGPRCRKSIGSAFGSSATLTSGGSRPSAVMISVIAVRGDPRRSGAAPAYSARPRAPGHRLQHAEFGHARLSCRCRSNKPSRRAVPRGGAVTERKEKAPEDESSGTSSGGNTSVETYASLLPCPRRMRQCSKPIGAMLQQGFTRPC